MAEFAMGLAAGLIVAFAVNAYWWLHAQALERSSADAADMAYRRGVVEATGRYMTREQAND